jgi:hypothetical protein
MLDKVCVLWTLAGNSKHRSFAFSAKRMVTTRRVFPANYYIYVINYNYLISNILTYEKDELL